MGPIDINAKMDLGRPLYLYWGRQDTNEQFAHLDEGNWATESMVGSTRIEMRTTENSRYVYVSYQHACELRCDYQPYLKTTYL